jgi:catechol 2,3-dioxygenase-like lactoylglutathione lyase family enzyme
MRIGIVDLFVEDQERALRFYTGVMALRAVTDAAYGEGGRWLTVRVPDDSDRPELLLTAATAAAPALQTKRQASGASALSLVTGDCIRDTALGEVDLAPME